MISPVSVEFPHFNYLGIWAKGGGNFVCIELLAGLCRYGWQTCRYPVKKKTSKN